MSGFWNGKNVFVTGCTGLLGSYLVKELIDQGANVTGLVRDQVPRSNLYQGSQFEKMNVVQGALEDMQTIERALENMRLIQSSFYRPSDC